MGAPLPDLAAAGAGVDLREPDPRRDPVDGVLPRAILVPRSADGVAAVLRWASDHRLSVVLRGGGTKLGWGRPPARLDAIVDLGGLARIAAHSPGDLTVTVDAGIPLGVLNRALSSSGQWLPLDPPFADRATIGGLLATNDSGPVRHRFGTPRDLVIGIQLATTDGRLARAGGQVVKNVAGYDLSKLASGSFGGLAAIVSATFKLSPVPPASGTVVVEGLDVEALGRLAGAVASSQLEPQAFEVHVRPRGPASCLLRFASLAPVVDAQVAAALAMATGESGTAHALAGAEERALWERHAIRIWEGAGAVIRASWLPAALPDAVGLLARLAGTDDVELAGRAAVGSGLVRIDAPVARQADLIGGLRASGVVGNVVVVRATPDLKAAVDVWGPPPNPGLLAALKKALDPNDTLGAGRGPL